MTDDRIRLTGKDQKALETYVKAICMSEWEGCLCTRPKRHVGLHRCGASTNLCKPWTDEQAKEWWEEFKKDL